MRGEYKTPGGKLVGVQVKLDSVGRICGCTVDGDFFAEGNDASIDAMMKEIGQALVHGLSVSEVMGRYPDVHVIGCDAKAIEIAFARARQAVNSSEGGAAMGDAVQTPFQDFLGEENEGAGALEWALGHGAQQSGRSALHLQVVLDEPRSPRDQIRVDTQWAKEVARGSRPATLRFWHWAQPAVIIGRNQDAASEVDEAAAKAAGFSVVRRPTGGGAMFIRPDDVITYSLYIPAPYLEAVDVVRSYQLCNRWLVDALHTAGFEAGFGGLNDIVTSKGKLAGSAQRRFAPIEGGPGAVLHHTTLSYDIDRAGLQKLLKVSKEKMSDKAVKSASKRVDVLRRQTTMSRDEVEGMFYGYAIRGV